jgi:hypothetical protein
LTSASDLLHKATVTRELQYMRIRVAIARDPNMILRIDKNAVLALWPFIAGTWPTPGRDQIAVGIELQHGWRRAAAFRAGWLVCCAALIFG